MTAIDADQKIQKGFRLRPDTKRLIELLAVLEDTDEGELLGRLLDSYLHYRSPQYRQYFTAAAAHVAKLLSVPPDEATDAMSELRNALAHRPLPAPSVASSLDEAKARLLARTQSSDRVLVRARVTEQFERVAYTMNDDDGPRVKASPLDPRHSVETEPVAA